MRSKINEKLESMCAELETGRDPLSEPVPAPLREAARAALRDWRSYSPESLFYQQGLALEGTIAAHVSGLYDSIDFNDDVRIFGVNPAELEFLTNQPEV
jgi:hypothetical protein